MVEAVACTSAIVGGLDSLIEAVACASAMVGGLDSLIEAVACTSAMVVISLVDVVAKLIAGGTLFSNCAGGSTAIPVGSMCALAVLVLNLSRASFAM